jgi:hypothetical protein
MEQVWFSAALWLILALIATLLSILVHLWCRATADNGRHSEAPLVL